MDAEHPTARQRADEFASVARIRETAALRRDDAELIALSNDVVQKSMKLLRDSSALVKPGKQRPRSS